jgi:arylsulfatase
VPPGEHQVRVEFTYDGGGIGKGGMVALYIDGAEAGSGRVDNTEPIAFGSAYSDVGRDAGPPVSDEYSAEGNGFTGTIVFLELEAGDDRHDHLIDPKDLFLFAMAQQ